MVPPALKTALSTSLGLIIGPSTAGLGTTDLVGSSLSAIAVLSFVDHGNFLVEVIVLIDNVQKLLCLSDIN